MLRINAEAPNFTAETTQGTIDFQLTYGEWIRCFRHHGLVVDDLVELRAPKHAHTSFVDFDGRWARRWPAEQVWVVRKIAPQA